KNRQWAIGNRKSIGAAAGNCTRTSSVAGRHSAVKSQPRKLKGPGTFMLPAHAISTKNKHLLLSCDTNPRFHGGCFGVWGHTFHKALKIKFQNSSRCFRPPH